VAAAAARIAALVPGWSEPLLHHGRYVTAAFVGFGICFARSCCAQTIICGRAAAFSVGAALARVPRSDPYRRR
jgi:hypothetical protein